MNDITGRVASLHIHPVKSCAGIEVGQALLAETGLDLDRAWMVVDTGGRMLTQRELPRLALVQPAFKGGEVVLRAPGMLALHLRVDTVEAATRAQVWDDIVKAYDMGALAAQWFSDYLGRPARLVRFDPEERRLSDPHWAGEIAAENAFADGFPLLVAGAASLAELNRRLAERGQDAVTMARFRPNLVLDGLPPFDEDHLAEIEIAVESEGGPVRLRLVKPCVRCSIPNVDPATGVQGQEPGATLAGFRADARMGGGITFGMNAVVVQGFARALRVGQAVRGRYAFGAA
ncbi:MOSC domain containing protein [Rubrivivax sp. A210]|uniref:MOSC domain-containing protein n=1 Tax=Rubrivivax sp. A210 TaxID=2772301 RepID=UPI00191970D6|nr:MOSC N-terminal beta barrel domain-containing protein [Rubrivivax sp. A210]CAD5372649.1 MOSC domain containing protein [Rubrivivax sp. A210]